MKIGSIYTDMIKPLELRIYNVILSHENDERRALDKKYPHSRDIYYDSITLQGFQEIRKNLSLIVEIAVLVSLWKDISITDFHFVNHCGLGLSFTRDISLTFWPNTVYWCISESDVEIQLPEWPSVVKGEMTPAEFVERLKALSQRELDEDADAQEPRKAPKERFKEMDNSVLSAVNRETKRLVSLINWSVIKAAVGRDCVFEELVPREEDRSLIDHAVYMLSNRSGSTLRFFSQSKEMMVEQVQTFVIDFIKNVATGAAMLDPDWEYHDGASQKKYIIQRLKMTPSVEDGHAIKLTSTEKGDCQNKKICPNGLDDFFFTKIAAQNRADIAKWILGGHKIAVFFVEKEFEQQMFWFVRGVYLCYEGEGYDPDKYYEFEYRHQLNRHGSLTLHERILLQRQIDMTIKEMEEDPNDYGYVDSEWSCIG